METATLTKNIESALKAVPEDTLSMYRLAHVASDLTGTHVREQMFYTYRANGMIKPDANGRITKKAATEFLTKFVGKRVA